MGAFSDRIDHWMSFEPTTALTVLIAAITSGPYLRRRPAFLVDRLGGPLLTKLGSI